MESKHVHQVIYREGLAELLRDRVRESMLQQRKKIRDIASQLGGEMGLKESTVCHMVQNLRSFPSFQLPTSNKCISVSPYQKLRRVSLVLQALNFGENEEVILRLRRLYGNDFVYPPGEKINLEQAEKPMNSWMDYL